MSLPELQSLCEAQPELEQGEAGAGEPRKTSPGLARIYMNDMSYAYIYIYRERERYTCIRMYIYIYIYIYTHREREREIDRFDRLDR